LDLLYIPDSSLITLNKTNEESEQMEDTFENLITCASCRLSKHSNSFTRKSLIKSMNSKPLCTKRPIEDDDQSEINSQNEVINQLLKPKLNQTNQQPNVTAFVITNQLNSNENICNECWIYWKKYGGFKSNQYETNFTNCKFTPKKKIDSLK
jgi:hypothetical protein